jgi:DNA/RNA-binding domain of Phe-tRNA-synthetase-like protein
MPKCTEYFTKEQIQRSIQFDEKVKTVLPYFYENKSFYHKQTAQNQHIDNLKNVRNEIVHTKSEKTFSQQEDLLKRILKFKFNETFDAVAASMNFYKKDYIVECDCGTDF